MTRLMVYTYQALKSVQNLNFMRMRTGISKAKGQLGWTLIVMRLS